MGESILKLQQIRKSFDHTEVLKGVDLEVAQGEFITLLGASGCGKTTTLRIIAGLELPDSGSVILEGRDITDWEPNKRDVNTVFQNYALFPHMNVADNVGYGLKIRKVPKAEITERVKQAGAGRAAPEGESLPLPPDFPSNVTHLGVQHGKKLFCQLRRCRRGYYRRVPLC